MQQLVDPRERQLGLVLGARGAQEAHVARALGDGVEQRGLADPGLACQHENRHHRPARTPANTASMRSSSASRPTSTARAYLRSGPVRRKTSPHERRAGDTGFKVDEQAVAGLSRRRAPFARGRRSPRRCWRRSGARCSRAGVIEAPARVDLDRVEVRAGRPERARAARAGPHRPRRAGQERDRVREAVVLRRRARERSSPTRRERLARALETADATADVRLRARPGQKPHN